MTSTAIAATEQHVLDQLDELRDKLATVTAAHAHVHRLATLGTVAAGLVHEINNFLTPALAYAQMAARHPEDQQLSRKSVAKTLAVLTTARDVIQSTLDLTKPNDGTTSTANVHQALEAAINCLPRNPARDNIVINRSVEKNLVVRIPPVQLQQVLLNLLLNARAALIDQAGGTITCQVQVQPKGSVRIAVTDTGRGVPTDKIDQLFQAPCLSTEANDHVFTNRKPAHPKRYNHINSSGLGLFVSKEIVTAAGGSLTFQQSPSGGATFAVSLTIVADSDCSTLNAA